MGEQFVTVAIIAVVLGMDAFSLALGLGLKGVSYRYEIKFSGLVALFHVFMPLMGLYLGVVSGRFLGVWAQRLGAVVLIYIGVSFLLKGLKDIRPRSYSFAEAAQRRAASGPQTLNNIWLLSCSVSMDALAVGFGLGTFQMPLLVTVLTMGTIAGLLTWFGFLGGRLLNRLVGSYAQMIGGLVLIALAVKLLWF
jgi:putative Mn2+ efflux pump MntP